jgi:hypothetical protein
MHCARTSNALLAHVHRRLVSGILLVSVLVNWYWIRVHARLTHCLRSALEVRTNGTKEVRYVKRARTSNARLRTCARRTGGYRVRDHREANPRSDPMRDLPRSRRALSHRSARQSLRSLPRQHDDHGVLGAPEKTERGLLSSGGLETKPDFDSRRACRTKSPCGVAQYSHAPSREPEPRLRPNAAVR